jgi:transposase-like protein
MRYAQRGGYTPAGQQRHERLRLEAAGRFARGEASGQIAHDLRVTEGSVRRWRRAWQDGGDEALCGASRNHEACRHLPPTRIAGAMVRRPKYLYLC